MASSTPSWRRCSATRCLPARSSGASPSCGDQVEEPTWAGRHVPLEQLREATLDHHDGPGHRRELGELELQAPLQRVASELRELLPLHDRDEALALEHGVVADGETATLERDLALREAPGIALAVVDDDVEGAVEPTRGRRTDARSGGAHGALAAPEHERPRPLAGPHEDRAAPLRALEHELDRRPDTAAARHENPVDLHGVVRPRLELSAEEVLVDGPGCASGEDELVATER